MAKYKITGLPKAQKGKSTSNKYYTFKGSKGVYRKTSDGHWEVDWNRTGQFRKLEKGNVPAREAQLSKSATPLYDQDYDEMIRVQNQEFKAAPKPAIIKKSPIDGGKEQAAAQKAFDEDFKVTDKSKYEKVEAEVNKRLENSRAFAKEQGLPAMTPEEEDQLIRDTWNIYGNVYDSSRGMPRDPGTHGKDSTVSFDAPANPTLGDYIQRGWDILTNPLDAWNYSVATGDVSNMPWNYDEYEQMKAATGYTDLTDFNPVTKAIQFAAGFTPAGLAGMGATELPRTYKAWADPNVSASQAAFQTGMNALMLLPGTQLVRSKSLADLGNRSIGWSGLQRNDYADIAANSGLLGPEAEALNMMYQQGVTAENLLRTGLRTASKYAARHIDDVIPRPTGWDETSAYDPMDFEPRYNVDFAYSDADIDNIRNTYGEQSPELREALATNAQLLNPSVDPSIPGARTTRNWNTFHEANQPSNVSDATSNQTSQRSIDDIRTAFHNNTEQLSREDAQRLIDEGQGDPLDYIDPNTAYSDPDIQEQNFNHNFGIVNQIAEADRANLSTTSGLNSRIESMDIKTDPFLSAMGIRPHVTDSDMVVDLYNSGIYAPRTSVEIPASEPGWQRLRPRRDIQEDFRTNIANWQRENNLPDSFVADIFTNGFEDPAFTDDLLAYGIDNRILTADEIEDLVESLDREQYARFASHMSLRIPEVATARHLGIEPSPSAPIIRQRAATTPAATTSSTSNVLSANLSNTPSTPSPTLAVSGKYKSQQIQDIPQNTADELKLDEKDLKLLDDKGYQGSSTIKTTRGERPTYSYNQTNDRAKYINKAEADNFVPTTIEGIDEQLGELRAVQKKITDNIKDVESKDPTRGLEVTEDMKHVTSSIDQQIADLEATKFMRETYSAELREKGLDPKLMEKAVVITQEGTTSIFVPDVTYQDGRRLISTDKYILVGNVNKSYTTNVRIDPSQMVTSSQRGQLSDVEAMATQHGTIDPDGSYNVPITDLGSSAVNFRFHPAPTLKQHGAPIDFYKSSDSGVMVDKNGNEIKSYSTDTWSGETTYYTTDQPTAGAETKPIKVNPAGDDLVSVEINPSQNPLGIDWVEYSDNRIANSKLKYQTDANGKVTITGPAKEFSKIALKENIAGLPRELHPIGDQTSNHGQTLQGDELDAFVDKQIQQLSDNYNNGFGAAAYRATNRSLMNRSNPSFLATHQGFVSTELPNPFYMPIFQENATRYVPTGSSWGSSEYNNLWTSVYNTTAPNWATIDRKRAEAYWRGQERQGTSLNTPSMGNFYIHTKEEGGNSFNIPYDMGGSVQYLSDEQIKKYRNAGYVVIEEPEG